ncbi:MAG: glycerophosphodiester phosphodiesterase [Myxococcota bacterium]|nr:glycerophosphodiester phosphodiesterase [Myxococcota bacterium]
MSRWAVAPLVVGHRGGRGEGWPRENTLSAFELAGEQGARAVELDVRTCAEGEVVVFHDPTLARATDGRDTRRVCDVPLGDLRTLDVPTLEEVLRWAKANGIAVNVEMKHDVPARHRRFVSNVSQAVRGSGADVLFSSFDPSLLASAAFYAPAVPRALLVHSGQARWGNAIQELARPPLVTALHLQRTQVDPRTVVKSLGRGLRLGAWTVNDPGEAVRFARLGVATIITDAPGAIAHALTRR